MDCFRTCDIRGRYPEEINEDLYFRIGRNIAIKFLDGRDILIGSDLRESSPALKQALARGLVEAGARVFDAGQAPTPVIYFGKRKLGAYAAAVVTASHNPPQDNGLKLVLGRYPATAAELRALRPDPAAALVTSAPGQVGVVDFAGAYLDFIADAWKDLRRSKGTPGEFVFDPGNGTWALLLKEILRRLEIPATMINAEPDGQFRGRSPDCSAPGNLSGLFAEVERRSAAAGMAWDGDGDRLAVCDNAGRHLMTDQLVLLLFPEILKRSSREKVLYDAKMSREVKAAIEGLGGIPVEEKSAHCYLEARMIKEDCLFGCEYSGHLFFRALGGADDGMYAALWVVDFLRRNSMPLTALAEALPKLFITPDLRISSEGLDFARLRHTLRQGFPEAGIIEFDGMRVEIPGAWALIRPSVSENKVSFRFEAGNPQELESIVDRVLRLLPECATLLETEIGRWRNFASNAAESRRKGSRVFPPGM